MENLGKVIVVIGIILIVVGFSLWFFGDKLAWLGRLPGDIRVERPELSLLRANYHNDYTQYHPEYCGLAH